MTKLLYSTAVAAVLFVSPAMAESTKTHWCERSGGHTALCVIGAVTILAIFAPGSSDKDRDHRSAEANREPDGPDTEYHRNHSDSSRSNSSSSAPEPEYPDWSQSDGCAWGSRDYGTCH